MYLTSVLNNTWVYLLINTVCHGGSPAWKFMLLSQKQDSVMSAWNTVIVRMLVVTHLSNSHNFSEVDILAL